jgi:hypothetical protein
MTLIDDERSGRPILFILRVVGNCRIMIVYPTTLCVLNESILMLLLLFCENFCGLITTKCIFLYMNYNIILPLLVFGCCAILPVLYCNLQTCHHHLQQEDKNIINEKKINNIMTQPLTQQEVDQWQSFIKYDWKNDNKWKEYESNLTFPENAPQSLYLKFKRKFYAQHVDSALPQDLVSIPYSMNVIEPKQAHDSTLIFLRMCALEIYIVH